jgi:hypothetical protein
MSQTYTSWGALSVDIPSSDSNWVEVYSPFLSAEEFSMSAWLKPDTLVHACRVINLPGDSTDYFNNNFEFEIRSHGATFGWVGRYSAPDGTLYSLQCPNDIIINKWYHVTWERKKLGLDSGTVALMVRDENDVLQWTQKMDGKKAPLMGGSRTPGARLRVGRGNPNSPNWYFIPPFSGKMDDLQISNFPAAGITGVNGPAGSTEPLKFSLSNNYPNPFNPSTRIRFEIPKALPTSLIVYDILGRKVRTVVNDVLHAGEHFATWNGKDDRGLDVASGVYFYTLKAGAMSATHKMMLLK